MKAEYLSISSRIYSITRRRKCWRNVVEMSIFCRLLVLYEPKRFRFEINCSEAFSTTVLSRALPHQKSMGFKQSTLLQNGLRDQFFNIMCVHVWVCVCAYKWTLGFRHRIIIILLICKVNLKAIDLFQYVLKFLEWNKERERERERERYERGKSVQTKLESL